MFARLLALVCLLQFGLCIGRSEPVLPSDHEVVVYLRAGAFAVSPSLPHMQHEVNGLMRAAGYRVDWRIAGQSFGSKEAEALVVLELRGTCQAAGPGEKIPSLPKDSVLASTAVANGKILPFSWVNCDNLTKLLGHAASGPREDFLYGQAIGRLVAHELYHILANDRHHAGSGIAKSAFNARDLLAEHFKFERTELASFRINTAVRFP